MIFYVPQPLDIDVWVTQNIITINSNYAILGNLINYNLGKLCCSCYSGSKTQANHPKVFKDI
jgi:hypothetical protein